MNKRSPRFLTACAACATLAFASAGWKLVPGQATAAETQHQHGSPARGMTGGLMSLDIYAQDGTLHLLTGVIQDGARFLLYQRSGDEGKTWSPAVRVDAHSPVGMFRRGNDAQIAALGSTLVAVWTAKGSGWGGGGPLAAGVSRDGGKSWQPMAAPADDGSTTTHALPELFANAFGFGLAWIDNRNAKTGVRYAELARAGTSWSRNTTVEAASCECCWNTAALKGNKTFLMYRGNMPRDMMLSSSQNATGTSWQHTSTIGAFDWKIEACPETGGSLVVTRSGAMHALVWTGKENHLGLHYLSSRDDGRTWTAPVRMGGEDARRSDLAAAGDGTLAAAWDDSGDNRIHLSIWRDASKWSAQRTISDAGNRAMGPRVIAVKDGFRVFWTEARSGTNQYELKSATTLGR